MCIENFGYLETKFIVKNLSDVLTFLFDMSVRDTNNEIDWSEFNLLQQVEKASINISKTSKILTICSKRSSKTSSLIFL